MSLAPVDFKLGAIIDLPPQMRRYGLYRWKTARGRPTKWHLIDTDRQIGESVRAYDAGDVGLPPLHAPIPMLCGVRTRGPVETRIRTWTEVCAFGSSKLRSPVCAACIIQVALAITNEPR